MMLATWLVEIYLSKINQLEDIAAAERSPDDVENLKVEKSLLEDEMRQFLSTYKVCHASILTRTLADFLGFVGEPRSQDRLRPA